MNNELYHHGIIGMKWGIRRYQNKDGSLTPAGRKKLGLEKFDNEHSQDTIVKKGVKATRVINADDYEEIADPYFGGSRAAGKKYLDRVLKEDLQYERKYMSLEDVKNSGRANGKEYYLSWFTDNGWKDLNSAMVTEYKSIKDMKVASGKQVVDALLEEMGSRKVADLLKRNETIKSATLDYTNNKELFNKVNDRFIKKGYDAIEDINDLETDMPVIVFKTSDVFGKPKTIQSGKEAVDEILKQRQQKS